MNIVLDVSATMEILLQKEKKDLFSGHIAEASWVIAPDLYVCELSNVVWKYYRSKVASRADCIAWAERGIALIDDFMDSRELWQEALGEGIKYAHSVYDLYYAVLARRNNAVLLTTDKTLEALCRKMKIACRF
ncbi:MAG: tRNA(fMet)-specific endonuclease VapC [Candidatus Hydrogenedentes bacterium ADurb.Bin101]|nr:MAG: tRNA(fMet)-specific endonuclease VapC [Candidatus Hydrogenedentes bacterium ADurb.Bin101]